MQGVQAEALQLQLWALGSHRSRRGAGSDLGTLVWKACVGRSMCDLQGSFQTALPWAPSLASLGAVSWQAVLCRAR